MAVCVEQQRVIVEQSTLILKLLEEVAMYRAITEEEGKIADDCRENGGDAWKE